MICERETYAEMEHNTENKAKNEVTYRTKYTKPLKTKLNTKTIPIPSYLHLDLSESPSWLKNNKMALACKGLYNQTLPGLLTHAHKNICPTIIAFFVVLRQNVLIFE